MPVRCVHESRKGKGYAYNTGMAEAKGDIFLFTDDDVRPPKNWIEGMCRPILRGDTQGVAGGFRTAPHLRREWMELRHHIWLATTENMQDGETASMTGGNMSFHRKVLDKVPAFDPELGPGALGLSEESLFARQMVGAGFRIITALDIVAEHHFNEDRFQRTYFLKAVEVSARSWAYVSYHWLHERPAFPMLDFFKRSMKLKIFRAIRYRETRVQVLPLWEERALYDYCFISQYLMESTRPRNYERFGLLKLRGDAKKVADSVPVVCDLSNRLPAGFLRGLIGDSLRAFGAMIIRKTRIRRFLAFLKTCVRQPKFTRQLFRKHILGRPVILVYRHGGIGDVVCTLPAVATLRRNEPSAVIVYLTRRVKVPVVECCPSVDLVVEEGTPLAKYCHRFLKPKCNPHPLLPDERNPPEQRKRIHMVEEFAKSIDLSSLSERSARLKVPANEQEQMGRRLRKINLETRPVVVIHTGPTWQVKEWPTANWRELVTRMKDELGIVVVQIGQDYCATGETRLSPRIEGSVDWVGQLSIKEMLALLKTAQLFVGIDSGMLHLAGAVSAPCVGVFGPTDPQCILPRESPALGVTSKVECLGCHHNVQGPTHWQSGCPNAIRCMSELSVEDVFLACSKLLGTPVQNVNGG
jgi:ADP-heptose:LPS heptosyltransferase/glycosyltransferase involved in cell wall biosynthesis